MRKLSALAFALIIITSFVLPQPTLASFSLNSFFNNWFFPTPPPRLAFPGRTPKPTLTPTLTGTPKPTATPRPTVKPTSSPIPTSTPSGSTDVKRDYIMNQINAYRKSSGLSQVKTDPYTCDFATIRAKEISTGFNHNGFDSRADNHTLPYPNYHYITENIAQTSDYKQVETLWQNSPGHAENMRADTPYVCVSSYGNNYAYEGWRP